MAKKLGRNVCALNYNVRFFIKDFSMKPNNGTQAEKRRFAGNGSHPFPSQLKPDGAATIYLNSNLLDNDGKPSLGTMFCSPEDVAAIYKCHPMYIDMNGYACTQKAPKEGGGFKFNRIHRCLFGALSPQIEVHHINGHKLDNRRENLQLVTVSEHKAIHKTLKSAKGR